jgi:hypothetical protein
VQDRTGARSATTRRRAIGWMVPTSLFTVITDDRDRLVQGFCEGIEVDRPASTPTRPPACSTGCSTAWCSIAEHTATPPRAACTPVTARLSASVPSPVNTTSLESTPSSDAAISRDSSRALRAARAARCEPDGLPKCSVRNGSIASTASGRIGVVAA